MSLAYISTSPASVLELYSNIKSTNGCHDAKSRRGRFFHSGAMPNEAWMIDRKRRIMKWFPIARINLHGMYEYGADSSSRRKGIIPMKRQKSAVASLPTYRVNTLGLGALHSMNGLRFDYAACARNVTFIPTANPPYAIFLHLSIVQDPSGLKTGHLA